MNGHASNSRYGRMPNRCARCPVNRKKPMIARNTRRMMPLCEPNQLPFPDVCSLFIKPPIVVLAPLRQSAGSGAGCASPVHLLSESLESCVCRRRVLLRITFVLRNDLFAGSTLHSSLATSFPSHTGKPLPAGRRYGPEDEHLSVALNYVLDVIHAAIQTDISYPCGLVESHHSFLPFRGAVIVCVLGQSSLYRCQ